MTFQDIFPERQAEPPKFPGQVITETVLTKLRLSQLRDLARAFEIQADLDAPKPGILPALMAAEKQGVFRQPPSRPYYLLRAGRHPDEPPLEHDDIYDAEGRIRTQQSEPAAGGLREYHALRKQVQELHPGVDLKGKKADELEGMLDVSPGS